MRKLLIVAARALALTVLYVLVQRVGRRVDFVEENQRVFWPQAGVALAGMLVLGKRYWPCIFGASVFVTRSASLPWMLSLGLAAANTFGAVAGAWLLTRFGRFDTAIRRVADVYAFVLYAVMVSPVINAILAVSAFSLDQPGAWQIAHELGARRWFGHAISNLVVAPVVLAWTRKPGAGWSVLRVGELALLVSLVFTVAVTAFTTQTTYGLLNYPLSFVPFPFVIWAAPRFGLRGAATTSILVAGLAILGTSQGGGPFARTGASPAEALFLLQLYVTALAISGLFLAAAMSERRDAEVHLKALTARLQEVREEERALVSREIHDELGQQLTGLKMVIHMLARRVPEDGGLRGSLAEVEGLADDAVKTVRRIATDLRPGILDDLGIVASLQWLCEDFQGKTGIPVLFRCAMEELPLDPARSTAIFRILQEALTNVARHANAQRVDVTFSHEGDNLWILVRDDGCGIRTDDSMPRSLGLIGMRERAELVGGSLKVDAVPADQGTGTRVLARIPAGTGIA